MHVESSADIIVCRDQLFSRLGTDRETVGVRDFSGIGSIVEVAIRSGFVCVRSLANRVLCWGANHRGQCADGSTVERSTPYEIPSLVNVSQLAVGREHACAVRTDRTVWCWGSSEDGRRGQMALADSGVSNEPTLVTGLVNVESIATGWDHTCAVLSGGLVRCWGVGTSGQLGDGNQTSRAIPTEVMW